MYSYRALRVFFFVIRTWYVCECAQGACPKGPIRPVRCGAGADRCWLLFTPSPGSMAAAQLFALFVALSLRHVSAFVMAQVSNAQLLWQPDY